MRFVLVSLKGAIDRDLSDVRALPVLECLVPARFVAEAGGDLDLDANAGGVAAFLFGVGAQFGEVRLGDGAGGVGVHHPIRRPISRCAEALDHDAPRTRSGYGASSAGD
jgi:hypothetical protein